MNTIRVMLIEDHPEYRDVLELTIAREPDMELVCKFGFAEEALASVCESPGELGVDVALLDLGLPGMSGLDALSLLNDARPQMKTVVLTQSDHEEDVLTAISRGASGYLLKSSSADAISDAIRSAYQGETPIDSRVAKYLVRELQAVLSPEEISTALTDRELEILTLVGEGLQKKEIAEQLGISSNTVRTHIVHIYEKLNVQNAPAAITKAYQQGILRAPKS